MVNEFNIKEIAEKNLFEIETLMDFYANKNLFDLGAYLMLMQIEARDLLEALEE